MRYRVINSKEPTLREQWQVPSCDEKLCLQEPESVNPSKWCFWIFIEYTYISKNEYKFEGIVWIYEGNGFIQKDAYGEFHGSKKPWIEIDYTLSHPNDTPKNYELPIRKPTRQEELDKVWRIVHGVKK